MEKLPEIKCCYCNHILKQDGIEFVFFDRVDIRYVCENCNRKAVLKTRLGKLQEIEYVENECDKIKGGKK